MRTPAQCVVTKKQVDHVVRHDGTPFGNTYFQGNTSITVSEHAFFFVEGRDIASLRGYSPQDHEAGRQLVWSWLWRAANVGGRAIYLTDRAHLSSPDANLPDSRHYRIVAFEDAIEEARALTFEQRAMNTLLNLYDYLLLHKESVHVKHWIVDEEQNPEFRFRKDDEDDGMAYGTTNFEAWTIYDFLLEQGYLRLGKRGPDKDKLVLTPKAYAKVGELRSQASTVAAKGFFVRKWDEKLDEFYAPITAHVASKTKCTVETVWARVHNEKIDDKIMRQIREATVVVVDVTGERFNVGLELGFAMGLRKPIVILRDRADCQKNAAGEPMIDLPFDIRTYNCIFYDRDKPDVLQEQLAERVLSAMADASEGTH